MESMTMYLFRQNSVGGAIARPEHDKRMGPVTGNLRDVCSTIMSRLKVDQFTVAQTKTESFYIARAPDGDADGEFDEPQSLELNVEISSSDKVHFMKEWKEVVEAFEQGPEAWLVHRT